MNDILPMNEHPYVPIPESKRCSLFLTNTIMLILNLLLAGGTICMNWIFLYSPILTYRDKIAHLFAMAGEFSQLIDSVKEELVEISDFINTTLPVVHQMHELLCRVDPQDCTPS